MIGVDSVFTLTISLDILQAPQDIIHPENLRYLLLGSKYHPPQAPLIRLTMEKGLDAGWTIIMPIQASALP